MTEQWKDVPGYEGQYQVSDAGNVRSLDRKLEQMSRWGTLYTKKSAGIMLRPGRMPGGHMSVALGRGNSQCVHKLVLLAFVGPPPAGHECLHGNGVPSDNRLANLRWGTRSENIRDKTLHDQGKLKVADIHAIKDALETPRHGQQRELAKAYGVSEGTISAIKIGRTHGYLVR
jgi:hypothetical protein